MPVKFQDFSIEVEAVLDETTIAWLNETARSIASEASDKCTMNRSTDGIALDQSYDSKVDDDKGEAQIGSPLEAAFWEEWGTGEYAAHGDGRKGWWVYVKDGPTGDGGKTYATEDEAKAVATRMRREGLEAYHTNGRKPNYTLEHAFDRVKNPAINRLKQLLRERTGSK